MDQQQIEKWLAGAEVSEAELARRCGYDKGNFHRMIRSDAALPTTAALRIYDATGLQLGGLAGLTKREIETARKIAA